MQLTVPTKPATKTTFVSTFLEMRRISTSSFSAGEDATCVPLLVLEVLKGFQGHLAVSGEGIPIMKTS